MRSVAQVDANVPVSDLPDMGEGLLLALRKHNWRRGFWYDGR
jgi:hypothetical protein